ncbi:MAG: hypothetical protein IH991_12935 [Planctomycetes bacterium]|nr:hypothetical protein [Planctomycetota bacterium]
MATLRAQLDARQPADAPLQEELEKRQGKLKRLAKAEIKTRQTPQARKPSGKLSLLCPNCGKKLSAPKKLIGKVAKCPACRHQVHIPSEADAASPRQAETVSTVDSLRARAAELGYEFIDLENVSVPDSVLELVPESLARELCILPVTIKRECLKVATSDPTDVVTLEKLQFILNCEIKFVMASRDAVVTAIDRYYGTIERETADSMLQEFTETAIDFTHIPVTDTAIFFTDTPVNDTLPTNAGERLIDMIIHLARKDHATYIHLYRKHKDDEIRVFTRVNGDLVEMVPPPRHLWKTIVARVKIMAGIDPHVNRKNLRGCIAYKVDHSEFDIQLRFQPTRDGGVIVMRLGPVDADQYRKRGNEYLESRELVEAAKEYRQAISLDRRDAKSILNTGICLWEGMKSYLFWPANAAIESCKSGSRPQLYIIFVCNSANWPGGLYGQQVRDIVPEGDLKKLFRCIRMADACFKTAWKLGETGSAMLWLLDLLRGTGRFEECKQLHKRASRAPNISAA